MKLTGASGAPKPHKLAPSDFSFLWEECKACFYRKVVLGESRPRMPFPKIFTSIDNLMKDFFEGKSTEWIDKSLPAGIVTFGNRWVRSSVIARPGHEASCFVVGCIDTMLAFEDHGYGVCDFKTSTTKDAHRANYGRQLHAYAYALEHPANAEAGLWPVDTLGLLCVEPDRMSGDGSQYAFGSTPTWIPIEKDEGGFLDFIDEVLTVLELTEAPTASPECGWCKYRGIAA